MLLGAPRNIHMQVGRANSSTRYHAYRTVPLPAQLRNVGELPFEGARSQNIDNNPMQSSRRAPAFDKAT